MGRVMGSAELWDITGWPCASTPATWRIAQFVRACGVIVGREMEHCGFHDLKEGASVSFEPGSYLVATHVRPISAAV